MIEGLSEQLTLYPASRYFQYSNLALTLAGEIAAAEAGMPYADLVQQRILTPLGLDATLPYLPTEAYGKSMAVGHSALDRAGQRVTEPPFDTSARFDSLQRLP
jgi:CubicO group peptidase (beta-lactamase class C family)